jgi:hypothetical protein
LKAGRWIAKAIGESNLGAALLDRNRQWKRSGDIIGSSKDKEDDTDHDRWRPLRAAQNKRIKGFQELVVVIGLDNEKGRRSCIE